MKSFESRHLWIGTAALAALSLLALWPLSRDVDPLEGASRAPSAPAQSAQEPDLPAELSASSAGTGRSEALGLSFCRVSVTAYSSTPDQTDDTPWITAAATRVRPGIVALSRDLLKTHTPDAPFEYGDLILVAGVGVFRVEDTMHRRWRRRADIWFPTRDQARRWGHRQALITKYDAWKDAPLLVAEEAHLDAILDSRLP
ncbi:MAG: hypothetical protein GF355_02840 [Candidatus Eisenbacteria bacterium]|nr:hypothetical protein [Candidatus Eisenbacteria bacterium]